MNALLREIRHSPLLWLLIVVPGVNALEHVMPDAHTLLLVLAVIAIVPLAIRCTPSNRDQNQPGQRGRACPSSGSLSGSSISTAGSS
jgi:hypothetical protein